MKEMCMCLTEQKLNEWYPYITLQEYLWLFEIVSEETKWKKENITLMFV